jgi:predicted pyridoxine 5'-phosphate oxidase superfamily flavin-nucleotide-binding protein
MDTCRPGSEGEHGLQERYGTLKRAAAFYDKQMLDHLNPLMREYIAQMEMMFIATADSHGECDTSFRAGPAGFVRVLDDRTVMYPEYRGNGVMASLGNIMENGHVGILFVDFFHSTVGLHVNGTARVVENEAVTAFAPILERMAGVEALHDQVEDKKKTPERWVVVSVVEAYIHCSKHIPLLKKLDKDIDWGTDSEVRKGGDYFKAKHDPRPWATPKEKPVRTPVVEVKPEPAPEPVVETPAPEPVVEQTAPEPVAAAATEQPADGDIEFPVEAVNHPSRPEKYAFGPEIELEERRADADTAARAAEHEVVEGDAEAEDILDLWVLPEWRPAPISN